MASNMIIAALLVPFILNVATATNVTRCFTCQSPGNPECEDEFDRTVGSSISCSSLSYGRSVDIPDLIQNVLVHERASNTTIFSFYCVKLGVRYTNGTNGIVRACHKHPDNVDGICDFIRAESISRLTNVTAIPNCDVCSDDDCNSAGSIYASVLMVFLAFILNKSC